MGQVAGVRGAAAAEPSPDGQRAGRGTGACTARGAHLVAGVEVNPTWNPAGVGSSSVGDPGRVHGGGTRAKRAPIALGKVGQRVPSARPAPSERSLLHALQL